MLMHLLARIHAAIFCFIVFGVQLPCLSYDYDYAQVFLIDRTNILSNMYSVAGILKYIVRRQ